VVGLNLELIKPPRLKPGATIGVAAVSGPVDEARLESGISFLREKGYRVERASNLGRRDGFLAGSDEERASEYRRLLSDDRIDAIFFARGGYGASRILDLLAPEEARAHPKIHLGASDLTALFAFLRRHAGLVTFYGPMVAVGLGDRLPIDWESVLSGATPARHDFAPQDVIASGSAEGELVGGCLSLLASLAGTPEVVRTSGAILFWEDTREEIYRLDRLLTQLERSGNLDGLRGMVIGSVVSRGPTESPEQIGEYLRVRFGRSRFPVACNFPAGHLASPRTLPLGARVRLDLEETGSLTFLEPGVAP
jgi:muramoyltetrapeptide carboxypeptidase